jgi:hypothetical protein
LIRWYYDSNDGEIPPFDIDEPDEIDDIAGIRNVISDPTTGDGAGSIIEIEPEHGSNQESC